jgi:hypothetical protein
LAGQVLEIRGVVGALPKVQAVQGFADFREGNGF